MRSRRSPSDWRVSIAAIIIPLAVESDCTTFLREQINALQLQLETVNALAKANDLPDAVITESGLKITPLDAAVPEAAQKIIGVSAIRD